MGMGCGLAGTSACGWVQLSRAEAEQGRAARSWSPALLQPGAVLMALGAEMGPWAVLGSPRGGQTGPVRPAGPLRVQAEMTR